MASNLSEPIRRGLLGKWYRESQATTPPTPFCEYLQQKLDASLDGLEAGKGRVLQSTSNAGQSVSYFSPADAPFSQSDASNFLATAAEVCPVCAASLPPDATDEAILACLQNTVGPVKNSRYADYTLMRGC